MGVHAALYCVHNRLLLIMRFVGFVSDTASQFMLRCIYHFLPHLRKNHAVKPCTLPAGNRPLAPAFQP
jgi:hypothetical protein